MNTAISVFNTVTALGADCVVANKQIIVIGGQGTPPNPTIIIPQAGIKGSSGVVTPVTEVDQVTTGTITGANSTSYSISLEYIDTVQKRQVTNELTYISGSTNTSNALLDEIANAFIAQIIAQPSIPIVPTLVSHTLVLTAVSTLVSQTNGTQQFSVLNTGAGIISFVTGTAAVAPVGLGFLWNQSNLAPNANITPTAYYYTVTLDYNDPAYGDVVMSNQTQVDKAMILVLSTATNVTTLVGPLGSLTLALTGAPVSAAVAMTTSSTLAYTAATGILTMTGGAGTFASQGIKVGDILSIDSAPTVYLPVLLITTNLLGVSTIGLNGNADISAGAYHIIHTS